MTKLEEMARAAYEKVRAIQTAGIGHDAWQSWEELSDFNKKANVTGMVEALKVLREPSEAMVKAVRDPSRANGSPLSKGFTDSWQAAIDALLAEGGQ